MKKDGGIGITMRAYEKKGHLVVQTGNVAAIAGRIPQIEPPQKHPTVKLPRNMCRRKYVTTSGRHVYYYFAQFKDRADKKRQIPLGTNFKAARDKLIDVLNEHQHRKSSDKTKLITLAEWAPIYLQLVSGKKSADRDRYTVRHLLDFFGNTALSEIRSTSYLRYKNHRLSSGVMRWGKQRKARIKPATINRELACLRHLLNLAADEGHLNRGELPVLKLESEEAFSRQRVLSEDEYTAYLSSSPAWHRRIAITAYETALSRKDLLVMTWDKVDRKKGVIRGKRMKTSVWQAVPITKAVGVVLDELKLEQKGSDNPTNSVFTREGLAVTKGMMENAHETANRRAKIRDFHFHDFRHTAKTRWRRLHIPVEISMRAAGQKSVRMHYRYVDLTEDDVVDAFKGL